MMGLRPPAIAGPPHRIIGPPPSFGPPRPSRGIGPGAPRGSAALCVPCRGGSLRRRSGYRCGNDMVARVIVAALLRALRLRWRHASLAAPSAEGPGFLGGPLRAPAPRPAGRGPTLPDPLRCAGLSGARGPRSFCALRVRQLRRGPYPCARPLRRGPPGPMRHPGFPPAPSLGLAPRGPFPGSRRRSLAPTGSRLPLAALRPSLAGDRVGLASSRARRAPARSSPGPPALLCGAGLQPRGLGGRGPPV